MNLKKVTLIVIIGNIFSFSIRAFGTVFPQIFKNIYLVKVAILFNIFLILSQLLFWLIFYKEYASFKKTTLKNTCFFAIVGSFAVSFLFIKKLPLVFGLSNAIFPIILMNPLFDVFVPLISSIFHLIFFIVFRNSLEVWEKKILNRPILSIIIGNLLFIFLHLIVLFNFIATNRFQWLAQMPRFVAVGTVPLIILAVLLILSFYYRFYYFIDSFYKMRTGNRR